MHNHGPAGDHKPKSRSAHRKGYASINTRKGTCGQVPQSNEDFQGSVQCLGGSGRVGGLLGVGPFCGKENFE
jgi:hypothetical protein